MTVEESRKVHDPCDHGEASACMECRFHRLTELLVRRDAKIAELHEALGDLFGLIERGELVRDISHDAAPSWAGSMMKFAMILARAELALVGPGEEAKA